MKHSGFAFGLLVALLASSSAFAFGKAKPVEPSTPPTCRTTSVTMGVNPPGSGDNLINTQFTTVSSSNCDPNFAKIAVEFRIVRNDPSSKFVSVIADSRFYTGDEQKKMYDVIERAESSGLDEATIAWAEGPGQEEVRQALALAQAGHADEAEAKFRDANQRFGKALARHYGYSENSDATESN